MIAAALDALSLALTAALATASTWSTPASWREQPGLAEPAQEALASAELDGEARAWGDPSTGIFALVQDFTAAPPVGDVATAIAEVHAAMRAELEAAGAAVESWEVQRGHAHAAFRLGSFRALARTEAVIEATGTLRARSALCFYNERDRARSEQQCTHFIESF